MLTERAMVVFHLPQFHLPQWYLLQASSPVTANPAPTVLLQLFTALMIGLLTAFAFQFLLATLGIAIGISALGKRPASKSPEILLDEQLSEATIKESGTPDTSKKSLLSKIGIPAGLGILITINIVLFAACFLAVRCSQVHDPEIGAIEGIVIWSAYFLVLLWISSNAVTSILGSILDLTAGGFRRLVTTITAAFQPPEDEPPTEAELIDRIRQEIRTALLLKDWQTDSTASLASSLSLPAQTSDSSNFIETPAHPVSSNLTDSEVEPVEPGSPVQQIVMYLSTAPAKKLTPKRVDRKLKAMLQCLPVQPGQDNIPRLDRPVLTQVLAQRTDLSDKQKQRVMQKITATWTDFTEERAHTAAAVEPERESAPEPDSEVDSVDSVDPVDPDVELDEDTRSSRLTHLFRSAAETTLNRALANLPDIVPQIKATLPPGTASGTALAPLALSVALAKVREAIDTIEFSSLDPDLLQQNLDRVMDVSQSGLTTLNRSVVEQMEQWRDRSIQQIDSIQQLAQTQLDTVKQQAQTRLEATRKAAALAAWWLFLTASTAALSATLAGALATGLSFGLSLPHLMPFRG